MTNSSKATAAKERAPAPFDPATLQPDDPREWFEFFEQQAKPPKTEAHHKAKPLIPVDLDAYRKKSIHRALWNYLVVTDQETSDFGFEALVHITSEGTAQVWSDMWVDLRHCEGEGPPTKKIFRWFVKNCPDENRSDRDAAQVIFKDRWPVQPVCEDSAKRPILTLRPAKKSNGGSSPVRPKPEKRLGDRHDDDEARPGSFRRARRVVHEEVVAEEVGPPISKLSFMTSHLPLSDTEMANRAAALNAHKANKAETVQQV